MAYVPTTFVDHSVEFPNRRKFTAVPGQADTFDVARAEGTVFAEGTKPDAANLNAEFEKIKTETDSINTSLTAPTVGMFIYDYQDGSHGFNTSPSRGADTFIPFSKGGLIPYLTWNEKTWDAGESSISATSEAADRHVECLRGAYLDLNTDSSWQSTTVTMPQSITVTFKTAKTVSKIELIAAATQNLYTPSDMVFYGSNDGTTWTTLIPSMKMPAVIGLQKEFEVSQNKGSYKYYKLTITAVHGGKQAMLTGMQFY